MRAAVLGSPVAHSLSPELHRAAYAELGLDWTYDRVEVDQAGLPAVVAAVRADPAWAGLSLTMPLKEAVLPLLDVVDDAALRVRAVNTVVLSLGLAEGSNTDVPGLVAAVRERLASAQPGEGPAVLLGGGATARSALAALADLGRDRVVAHLRRPEAGADLVACGRTVGVDVELAGWDRAPGALGAPLVVSTVPSGAADPLAASAPARVGVLVDVVYAPWPTPLARAWQARGGAVVSGLDLLVHQAVLQVVAMTRTTVPAAALVPALRAAAERAVGPA